MDIWGLLTGGASAAAGGVLGGVFGLGKSWMENHYQAKRDKLEADEREKDRAHDLALVDKEIEAATRRTADEMAAAAQDDQFDLQKEDLGNIKEYLSGQKEEQKTLGAIVGKMRGLALSIAGGFLVLAEVVRKLVRPVLTAALVGATLKLAAGLGISVGDLPAADRLDLFRSVVDSVLLLTSVAVHFWFLSRKHVDPGRRL